MSWSGGGGRALEADVFSGLMGECPDLPVWVGVGWLMECETGVGRWR